MAYRRRAPARRSYSSRGGRSYAPRGRATARRSSARRTTARGSSRRTSGRQQTVRVVLEMAGAAPAARPNPFGSLIPGVQTKAPRKAKL